MSNNSELRQQRRRRPRIRHLKSEVSLLQTLSRLFHLVHFVKCWQYFLELNFKRLHQNSGKETESRCLVFTSSVSRRSRALTAKKCTKKRDARAKLLFCQSKAIAFLPFSLTSTSSLLKLPDGQFVFPVPSNSPRSLCDSLLGPVSWS